MPHRVATLGTFMIGTGSVGAVGTGVAAWAIDPDYAKAIIGLVGMAFMAMVYKGFKDVLPLYISARKQIKQMQIDLAEMDLKASSAKIVADRSRGEIDDLRGRADESRVIADKAAAQIEEIERKHEMELEATRLRWHDRFDDISAQNGEKDVQIMDLQAEVARLQRRLGTVEATHSSGINANSDNIEAVAADTRTPLPAPLPHLETTPDPPQTVLFDPPARPRRKRP